MTRRWVSFAPPLAGLLLMGVACSGTSPPPKRGVLERDIGAFKFRRYQQILDVEVWVPKNEAVAHAASYVHKDALKRGRVTDRDVVNAFVTRYENDRGVLSRLVVFARRLSQDAGYAIEEGRVRGVRLIRVSGYGEAWVLWSAKRHVVKIGGRGLDKVPSSVISRYGKRYPSRLKAGILEGLAPQEAPESPDSDLPIPDLGEGIRGAEEPDR